MITAPHFTLAEQVAAMREACDAKEGAGTADRIIGEKLAAAPIGEKSGLRTGTLKERKEALGAFADEADQLLRAKMAERTRQAQARAAAPPGPMRTLQEELTKAEGALVEAREDNTRLRSELEASRAAEAKAAPARVTALEDENARLRSSLALAEKAKGRAELEANNLRSNSDAISALKACEQAARAGAQVTSYDGAARQGRKDSGALTGSPRSRLAEAIARDNPSMSSRST